MTKAIEIQGLVKRYGDKLAVDHLDLEIEQGGFFGLLGPNGAGKTTTINAITGLVRPNAGTIKVMGHDAWKEAATARSLVGVSPQEFNFDDFLGLERILAYHAGYFGMNYAKAIERARELLRFFDLHEYRQKRTSTLSGGMKRRLLLARAVMHEPQVLILDEPTAGVDVELRRSLWQYVTKLNEEENITVLLTTHYLEEAEALCDDVAVIDHGRIIEQGAPDDLRAKYGSRRVKVRSTTRVKAADLNFKRRGEWYVREDAHANEGLPRLLSRIQEAGGEVVDVEVTRSRLEDVFVSLTKRDQAHNA